MWREFKNAVEVNEALRHLHSPRHIRAGGPSEARGLFKRPQDFEPTLGSPQMRGQNTAVSAKSGWPARTAWMEQVEISDS